jgi:hypothetical protein
MIEGQEPKRPDKDGAKELVKDLRYLRLRNLINMLFHPGAFFKQGDQDQSDQDRSQTPDDQP